MSILDTMAAKLGFYRGQKEALGPSLLAATARNIGGAPRPTVHNMQAYLGRYADQAWVFACIRIIQTKGAGVPLKIYRREGQDLVEVPDHPLQVLLDAVNPFMDGYGLREATHGFVELTGNAYWLLDNIVAGKPTEIYPLRPDRVKIKADGKKGVTGYVYEINPGQVAAAFAPEEILHFKTWNPLDDFYGLAPISAARDASDSMMHADRYNRFFFENSAEPGGILTSDATISDEGTRNRIIASWKSLHQGVRKAHRIAVLDGGLKFQSTSATHRDMQFPELKRMTREDILSVYGIPPVMVGVFDEANYSNAQEQRRIFWIDTMIPKLKKIESVINERLVKAFDPNLVAAYDLSGVEALQKDEKLRAESDEILTRAGIVTINEARKSRKMDPVSWGDTWNAPIGLMPIEEPRGSQAPADEPSPEDTPVPPKPPKAITPVPAPALIGKDTPEEIQTKRRDKTWQLFKGETESIERRWFPSLRRLFSDQEKEVIRRLQDSGWKDISNQARLEGLKNVKQSIDVILFDKSNARKVFRRDGAKLIEYTLTSKAKREAALYDLGTFNVENPRVRKWIDEKAFKFADEVNGTTEDALRLTLQEAVAAGEAIGDVEKRIEQVFDLARGYRTERIARTEVISASNRGAMAAYEESGAVQSTEWITARDENVRDSHKIDGEERNLGAQFSNGLQYPGEPGAAADEIINCRCTIAPVIRR